MEGLVSLGTIQRTEIFNFLRPDGSQLPGTFFKYRGGIMTARHVINASSLTGFTTRPEIDREMDIAYRPDTSCDGLPLGYTSQWYPRPLHLLTSPVEQQERVVEIQGSVGSFFSPTILCPFSAIDQDDGLKYFVRGLSGSPLVYKDHIIGIVPFRVKNRLEYKPNTLAVLLFSGQNMRNILQEFGLLLEEID